MTTVNFTGDGKKQTFEQLLCTANLTAELHSQLTFISVLNSFLSLTAFLGNALILIALHKESSLHPPSKLLLRNLATTDFCVGLLSEPVFVAYGMSVVNGYWNICRYVYKAGLITSHILCGVSLSTMTATSVDRLLALFVVTEIQTSCNFKANLCDRYYLMGYWRCLFSNGILESPNNLMVWYYRYTTVFNNLDLLLHKDFPHPLST